MFFIFLLASNASRQLKSIIWLIDQVKIELEMHLVSQNRIQTSVLPVDETIKLNLNGSQSSHCSAIIRAMPICPCKQAKSIGSVGFYFRRAHRYLPISLSLQRYVCVCVILKFWLCTEFQPEQQFPWKSVICSLAITKGKASPED